MMINLDATKELLKDGPAFLLLTQVATRARRQTGDEMHNGCLVHLEKGQAFVGDYLNCGLKEHEYRTAKDRLTKRQLCTFKGTNKGTIATIINTDVYDINMVKVADKPRTRSEQGATNKNEKNVNKEKNVNTSTTGKI